MCKLVDVTHPECVKADEQYYTHQISIACAVKRCLQSAGYSETDAIRILDTNLLIEAQKGGHLPSACASVHSKRAGISLRHLTQRI